MAINKVAKRHALSVLMSAVAVAGQTELSAAGYADLLESEALVLTPYYDSAGVLTTCYGETEGIEMRDYTPEECSQMLVRRVEGDFVPQILACTRAEVWYSLGQPTRDATIEFAYNVGSGAYCRGSVSKRFNTGRGEAACERMLLYNKIRKNGKLVPSKGLTNRRNREAAKCRSGFA